MPDTADAYAFEVSDKAKSVLGNLEGDPAVTALREFAKEAGYSQREFDKHIGGIVNHLADKGLLQPNFDAAAETAQLSEGGQDGKARQAEVKTFADSLLARKDIDAKQHAELISLMPTAAGVRLVEAFRKMAADGRMAPSGAGGDAPNADLDAAREMRLDPKYKSDPLFRKNADAAYVAATRKR